MTRVQNLFEATAKKVIGPNLDLSKNGLGDYMYDFTEDLWSLFSLAYCYGDRDATKSLHELEDAE